MGGQNKLSKQAEELKSLVCDWIPKRKATVHTLRVLAEKLMTHHNNVCIAQVAGASSSVAGFTLMAVGFGLSFVTFGASLVLTAVGGGISAAGGVTAAGSLIAEGCIQKDTFDTAQKIINEDREATEAIQKLLEEFGKQAREYVFEKGFNVGFTAANAIKNCAQIGFKLGVRAGATAASEGGEALFRGQKATEAIQRLLEELGKEALKKFTLGREGLKMGFGAASKTKNCVDIIFKLGVRAGATAASEGGEALFRGLSVAGKAAHIGGFAFSVVFLPLDIYTLVTSSMKIDASRKGKKVEEPKAVKKLKELADELAKGMPDEKEFARQIDDFVSSACTLD